MMQDDKKQTGCCLGKFCPIALIIITKLLVLGMVSGTKLFLILANFQQMNFDTL